MCAKDGFSQTRLVERIKLFSLLCNDYGPRESSEIGTDILETIIKFCPIAFSHCYSTGIVSEDG